MQVLDTLVGHCINGSFHTPLSSELSLFLVLQSLFTYQKRQLKDKLRRLMLISNVG